ncbi:hypothetical protein TSAR_011293 [Trichomalopsis sarcophagae]|uniref:Uncharacterized protein n=1 Tax=Trichomalopsis sarcophagae TaxID=543379 RepID=A0A232EME4_9HYME|nr:hypothetical protein TSAR_011293 [Trichomalopsis sarcophagae]
MYRFCEEFAFPIKSKEASAPSFLYTPVLSAKLRNDATVQFCDSYGKCMSENRTYGGEVEIDAFVKIYRVKVSVRSSNFSGTLDHVDYNVGGANTTNHSLDRLLIGEIDRGHYDVLKSSVPIHKNPVKSTKEESVFRRGRHFRGIT